MNKDKIFEYGILSIIAILLVSHIMKAIKEATQNATSLLTGGLVNSVDTEAGLKELATYEKRAKVYFNKSYWKDAKKGAKLLKVAEATQMSERINDAIGYFTNDGETIYKEIAKLTEGSQLSFLAETFYKKYGKNLFNHIAKLDNRKDILHGINPFGNNLDFTFYTYIIIKASNLK